MTGLALALAVLMQVPGPVDDAPIDIEQQAGYCDTGDIAYCPSTGRYLSIYTGENVPPVVDNTFDLRAVTVDPATGAKGTPHNLDSGAMTPALCWNPASQTFLAAYTVNLDGRNFEVRGRRLDAAGVPVGSTFLLSPNNNGWTDTRPRIACNGTSWMVVWRGASTILGRSVSAQGVLEGDELFIRAVSTGCPAIAFGAGPDYLVAWRYGGTSFTIEGRTVSAAGVFGSVETYSTGSTTGHILDAGAPSVVAIPPSREFLVGWVHQDLPTPSDVRGVPMVCRADAAGHPLTLPTVADGRPLQWSRRASAGTLALEWNPASDQVLAAWLESGSLRAARLNPYGLSVLEKDIMIAWPGNPITDYTGPRTSIASRDSDSQVIVQWSIWPGFDYSRLQALRYDMGPDVSFLRVDDAGQFAAGPSGASIPAGDSIHATAFEIQATYRSYRLNGTVEVEVRESGTPFLSTATHAGAAVADGTPVRIRVDGLAINRPYRWQIRAVDSTGPGDWMAFSGNPADVNAVDFRTVNATPDADRLDQALGETGARILGGQVVAGGRVKFSARVNDLDGDPVRVSLEVAAAGSMFTGTPTATSDWIPAGGTATFDIALAAGSYHWQVRVEDPMAAVPGWLSFGAGSGADFTLLPFGSSGPAAFCAAVGSTSLVFAAFFAAIVFATLNRRNG